MTVRPDVVEAIVAVFDSGDPETAPADATPEEREQADQQIDHLLAHGLATDPAHLASKALMQAYRPGDDWTCSAG